MGTDLSVNVPHFCIDHDPNKAILGVILLKEGWYRLGRVYPPPSPSYMVYFGSRFDRSENSFTLLNSIITPRSRCSLNSNRLFAYPAPCRVSSFSFFCEKVFSQTPMPVCRVF